MIRVVIERLFKGKSPLEGDNRHLHHIILNVSNEKTCMDLQSDNYYFSNYIFKNN